MGARGVSLRAAVTWAGRRAVGGTWNERSAESSVSDFDSRPPRCGLGLFCSHHCLARHDDGASVSHHAVRAEPAKRAAVTPKNGLAAPVPLVLTRTAEVDLHVTSRLQYQYHSNPRRRPFEPGDTANTGHLYEVDVYTKQLMPSRHPARSSPPPHSLQPPQSYSILTCFSLTLPSSLATRLRSAATWRVWRSTSRLMYQHRSTRNQVSPWKAMHTANGTR